jgi:hypothetical protein
MRASETYDDARGIVRRPSMLPLSLLDVQRCSIWGENLPNPA